METKKILILAIFVMMVLPVMVQADMNKHQKARYTIALEFNANKYPDMVIIGSNMEDIPKPPMPPGNFIYSFVPTDMEFPFDKLWYKHGDLNDCEYTVDYISSVSGIMRLRWRIVNDVFNSMTLHINGEVVDMLCTDGYMCRIDSYHLYECSIICRI